LLSENLTRIQLKSPNGEPRPHVTGLFVAWRHCASRFATPLSSIHPGLVHTSMGKGVTTEFMAPIPMRRGAAPTEIASFVVDGGLMGYVPTAIERYPLVGAV
jgi:hypothetical protein